MSCIDRSNTMKKVVIVILWAVLSATSAMAVQVCPSGILQTTPTADFTDHGDGTITHKRTGLMWKKCVEGLSGSDCATGSIGAHTWQGALQLADGHSFAGYSDWRLPNVKELISIVEFSCFSPAINLSVFTHAPDLHVWSSSLNASNSDLAWMVDFGFGGSVNTNRVSSSYIQVRLVRGGQ